MVGRLEHIVRNDRTCVAFDGCFGRGGLHCPCANIDEINMFFVPDHILRYGLTLNSNVSLTMIFTPSSDYISTYSCLNPFT